MDADEARGTGRAVAPRPSSALTPPAQALPAQGVASTRLAARLQRAHAVADLRGLAARRLPKAVFDFIDGGAEDERTLRDNVEAFDAWMLMPRVGVDVGTRDLSCAILGARSSLPVMMAPTGLAGFFWPDGEVAGARAAARAGIPYCLSTNSVGSIEHVAKGAPDGERWFQLYFLRDRDWMQALLRRAAAARYRVLCLTVDLAVQGRRERDLRNAFTMPLRPRLSTAFDLARRPGWLAGVARSRLGFGNFEVAGPGFTSVAQHVASLFDPSANWDDIARIRESWRGPMALKGLLHPADAERAVALGIEAVIVSNHGGRQLDDVPAAIEALPDVAAAVAGRAEVILDGGVRRGTDVIKALALGATACSLGRPFLWGLAAGGTEGVARTIEIFRSELDNAMTLLGTPALKDIARDHVRARRGRW
ncbi:alpha-hydroxy acid oxidase [Methylobacterium nonmethylotrophicum]|uniref:Alpha-hydroxy-acid oxidizing protein n=1 Tax=Methylobacterium nonmethylotrophicum TaxID=1141884 RepID=A0A4Z0NPK6_9HYPH|nr:alpha-hydroxy acid oxidase [Methylobacterium nonmethylotrophicum]TGD98780.1 alpha-hydroxy-acid oxidizing protein [Methylobacterium nonmethylotrophicum]